jgi:hypothetical protein
MSRKNWGVVVVLAAGISAVGCHKSNEPEKAAAPSAAPAIPPAGANPSNAAVTPPSGGAARPPETALARSTLTIPQGQRISIRTTTALSTKSVKTGDAFTATLAQPIMAGETVIAPKGAQVDGVVTESDPGGRVKGRATIAVRLTRLHIPGDRVAISTNSVAREARGSKTKDAATVGIGSAVGAAIGAIAGGGTGAAIGAASGAGAGGGVVLATRGNPAVIPAESLLTFRLTSPVTVTK